MRIFATSDVHGNCGIMDKLKAVAPKSDLILVCGDIGGKDSWMKTFKEFSAYQRESADYLSSVLEGIGTESRFILGNDDWFEYEGSRYLQQPMTMDGINIIPFEYVLLTPFNTNREVNDNKIAYELDKLSADGNTIIAAHMPPYGAGDILHSGKHCGSDSVREWILINRPKIWFCGHIHENNSVTRVGDTLVFNCACRYQDGMLKGWLVDTDTMTYEAVEL